MRKNELIKQTFIRLYHETTARIKDDNLKLEVAGDFMTAFKILVDFNIVELNNDNLRDLLEKFDKIQNKNNLTKPLDKN